MIAKTTYVQIFKVVLNPGERAENIPADTKNTPLELRLKGVLNHEASIGDVVTITTPSGRQEQGILIQVEPYFKHSFGHHVNILQNIRKIILDETEGLS
ncbi:MAG: 2-amino-4-ketopentanoate thiolase [Acholeplasmataceae bacterium]|nr:2-amino-4-ketopentanoate thiolase [Acholeplasmataceae bacterium]